MIKIIKVTIAPCLLIILLVFWASDLYYDRQHRVIIRETTGLFHTPEDAAYTTDLLNPIKPFKELQLGEAAKVKRITTGKDFMALKLETNDGTVGWVVSSNHVQVIYP